MRSIDFTSNVGSHPVIDFGPFGRRPLVRCAHRKLRLSESKESLLALPSGSSFVKQNLFNFYIKEWSGWQIREQYQHWVNCYIITKIKRGKPLNRTNKQKNKENSKKILPYFFVRPARNDKYTRLFTAHNFRR